MNSKKTLRLLAASWLIAPTILAAHPVFAVDSTPQNSGVGTITSSSAKKTSKITSTTSSSAEGTTETTDSSQVPETEDHTLFIDTELAEKVQFKTMDGFILDVSSGSFSGLTEGTEITYTIQPDAKEEIVSVEVSGADLFEPETHQLSGTFTIGAQDATFKVVFQPIGTTTDSSTEESTTETTTDSSVSETTDSTTSSTTDETTDSSRPSNNEGNNSNNNNTSSSGSNTNRPSGSSNNQRPTSSSNAGKETRPNRPAVKPSSNNTATKQSRPASDPLAIAGTNSSRFVTKTPVNATLPTNTTATQKAIVEEAYKYLGAPYVWGAKGADSFDCSGLAYYVYMKATGHNIGGWTGEQQYAGTQIPVSEAQPGDLVFWGPASGITHHVGVYIGNGKFIHAPQPGDFVRITSISNYQPDFAVRVNLKGLPSITDSSSSILDNLNQFHFSKNQTTDQFLAKISEFAREIGQKKDIFASVMLAQAILESGSGNSLLSSEPNHNLFGIKGSFKKNSVSFNTLEQDAKGHSFQIRAQFRKYPSYKESLEDYADLIKNGISGNKDFYKPAWKSEAKTYQEATKHLQGRYATDKQYAQKLNAIIKAYDLTQYDEPKKEKTPEAKTFTAPVNWSIQQKKYDQSKPLITQSPDISPFFSGFTAFKIASVWDIFYSFTTKQMPVHSQIITLPPNLLPTLSPLLINSWWKVNQ